MTPTEIAQQKDELRREVRARRNSFVQDLSPEDRVLVSEKIAQRVLDVVPQNAQVVAVYLANGNEANIDAAIQTLIDAGKVVVAPRVGVRPKFARLTTLENLRTNARGLRFPDSEEQFSAWQIEVFMVPGIAFDGAGKRLGQGGGWYDKVLERARAKSDKTPWTIGVCYDCQIVDTVPQNPHDQRVDIVVTEDRVLEVAGRHHDC